MCKRSVLHVVFTFWLLSGTVFASGARQSVLTGTVNIVLANSNGIVVLTDSNQTVISDTGELFTSPLPGQKLFRLDDRTVCTIAGFGSQSHPEYTELTTSAGGVLDRRKDSRPRTRVRKSRDRTLYRIEGRPSITYRAAHNRRRSRRAATNLNHLRSAAVRRRVTRSDLAMGTKI
jgi:hypothetical protein